MTPLPPGATNRQLAHDGRPGHARSAPPYQSARPVSRANSARCTLVSITNGSHSRSASARARSARATSFWLSSALPRSLPTMPANRVRPAKRAASAGRPLFGITSTCCDTETSDLSPNNPRTVPRSTKNKKPLAHLPALTRLMSHLPARMTQVFTSVDDGRSIAGEAFHHR